MAAPKGPRVLAYAAHDGAWTAFRVFASEVAALRYAVRNGFAVTELRAGDDPKGNAPDVANRERLTRTGGRPASAPVSDPPPEDEGVPADG
jgi:hypothetical protein